MHVKEFAQTVADIAREVHCNGGTAIASHKIPSSVHVIVGEQVCEVVSVEVDRLMGCGCWSGIDIIARPVTEH